MRFVPQIEVKLSLPNDWQAQVLSARHKVWAKMIEADEKARSDGLDDNKRRAAVVSARAKAITSQSKLWSDLGKVIRHIENEKCWYCEMGETRSDMPVDHFRPKNSVAECDDHPGYYWLAFEWTNFRFSCTYCNSRRVDVETSGGKQDHFPLLVPAARRMSSSDKTKEHPVLLDPCVLKDTKLLTYHKNGLPAAKTTDRDSDEYQRVHKSIELYHLDHYRVSRKRKTIAAKIEEYVQRVEDIESQATRSENDEETIMTCKTEIILLAREKADLCTVTRIYLEEYRRIPWVADIIGRDF